MEQLRSAMEEHMEQMADLVQKLSAELRSGLKPALDNFLGFFHAINWKEPWLMGLIGIHFMLLIVAITSRKNLNFQMFLFLLAYTYMGNYFMQWLEYILQRGSIVYWVRTGRAFPLRIILIQMEFFSHQSGLGLFSSLQS
ncbi:unnamed protein product [Prunus armeniaca]